MTSELAVAAATINNKRPIIGKEFVKVLVDTNLAVELLKLWIGMKVLILLLYCSNVIFIMLAGVVDLNGVLLLVL